MLNTAELARKNEFIITLLNDKVSDDNVRYFTPKAKELKEKHTSKENEFTCFLHKQFVNSILDALNAKKINGECVYNKDNKLFCIKIKNRKNRFVKIYYINEDGKTISSIADYNPENGKMTKIVLYRTIEMTISSVKEFDKETGKALNTTFFHKCGKKISSMFEYDKNNEIKYTLFCADGEIITSFI